jgi:hypothetical protein
VLVVRAGGSAIPHIDRMASVLTQRPYVMLNGTGISRGSWLRRILPRR